LRHYTDKVEVDPARLQELEERLNLIHSLKRKYGGNVGEIVAFGEEARAKLQTLEQRDAELARINAALEKVEAELWSAGQALSAKRRKAIPLLSKAVSKQLADLGFKQSRFEISLATLEQTEFKNRASRITHHGFDTAEFQFAPNPGEPARPLRREQDALGRIRDRGLPLAHLPRRRHRLFRRLRADRGAVSGSRRGPAPHRGV